MLASWARGRRIDSLWVYCCFHILIPFRFLRDRRKKWDGGTKKWDQKVGPKSGTNRHLNVYISLFSSYYCQQPLWPSIQDARLRSERKSDRVPRLAPLGLYFSFHISAVQKSLCAIGLSWGYSTIILPLPSQTNNSFQSGRICMGRNDDNSCVILTIQTVPLSFKKSGTTQHHQPPTTWVDFLWIFIDNYPREFPTINHIYPNEKSCSFFKCSYDPPERCPTSP